jgi:hypothetical protein
MYIVWHSCTACPAFLTKSKAPLSKQSLIFLSHDKIRINIKRPIASYNVDVVRQEMFYFKFLKFCFPSWGAFYERGPCDSHRKAPGALTLSSCAIGVTKVRFLTTRVCPKG